ERPATRTSARGRTPDTGSSTPACTAVATARTWAPAIEAWSSAPVASASRSASTSSRTTGPAVPPGSGTDDREDLVDDRGDALLGGRLRVEPEQRLGARCPELEPGPLPEGDGHTAEPGRGPRAGTARLRRGLHPLGLRLGRVEGRVELAGRGVAAVARHDLRERGGLSAERGQDMHRGEHAGIGTPEIAEV